MLISAGMEKSISVMTKTPGQTSDLGRRLTEWLRPGSIVALFGDLGAGKTVLAQAIGRQLGVRRPLRSPTFVVETRYLVRARRIRMLYHLDLYRMHRISSHDLQMIDEGWADRRGLTVIEWADRLGRHLPKRAIRIRMAIVGDNRRIKITGLSSRALRSLASRFSASAVGR